MKQFTQEEAISFFDNKLYEEMDNKAKAAFQVEQDLLCMPFDVFHEAITEALGRPVYTHELAFRDELRKELNGEKQAPSLDDILNLIPEEKRLLITF